MSTRISETLDKGIESFSALSNLVKPLMENLHQKFGDGSRGEYTLSFGSQTLSRDGAGVDSFELTRASESDSIALLSIVHGNDGGYDIIGSASGQKFSFASDITESNFAKKTQEVQLAQEAIDAFQGILTQDVTEVVERMNDGVMSAIAAQDVLDELDLIVDDLSQ